jgi:hypothetical protein
VEGSAGACADWKEGELLDEVGDEELEHMPRHRIHALQLHQAALQQQQLPTRTYIAIRCISVISRIRRFLKLTTLFTSVPNLRSVCRSWIRIPSDPELFQDPDPKFEFWVGIQIINSNIGSGSGNDPELDFCLQMVKIVQIPKGFVTSKVFVKTVQQSNSEHF